MSFTLRKNNKRIYLDYASAAPILPAVSKAVQVAERTLFGNPSSIHKDGVDAKRALQNARAKMAQAFGALADEIVFTSGGTESNNLAIFGTCVPAKNAEMHVGKKLHVITTKIEHPSILKPFEALEKLGFDVTYIEPQENGVVDPKAIAAALRPETIFVSVSYINNEIGTIQPIREIAKVIRSHKKDLHGDPHLATYPLLHVDACQAIAYSDIAVEKLGVDLMSWNSTKIGGPRGVGALYIRRRVEVSPIYFGGGQENNIRSGTENVPGVLGFTCALERVRAIAEKENQRLLMLRDFCISEMKSRFLEYRFNGSLTERSVNNINISFPGFSSELLVLELDAKGISVSAGSACASSKNAGSHVLAALYGSDDENKWGSIRITLGKSTTKKDIQKLISSLSRIFEKYKKTGIL